jgi:transposase InsO family protein
VLRQEIVRVRSENFTAYGSYKTWRAMNRQGISVARCAVEHLMREMGLRGVVCGKSFKTTTADDSLPQPANLVDRKFEATRPNQLWVSDLMYVRTAIGFVYLAFVIDVFSRRIVGWSASSSLRTELALEALEQAIFDRGAAADGRLIHHSDRGVQSGLNRSSQRLPVLTSEVLPPTLQLVFSSRATSGACC